MSKVKAYAIGAFYNDKKRFEMFKNGSFCAEAGRADMYHTREQANAALERNRWEYPENCEPIVVEVVVSLPKWKKEMTKEEIEKALGYKIVILK